MNDYPLTWRENTVYPGQHWLLYISYGRRDDLVATIHRNYPGDKENTFRWRIEKRDQFASGVQEKLDEAMLAVENALEAQERAKIVSAEARKVEQENKQSIIQLKLFSMEANR